MQLAATRTGVVRVEAVPLLYPMLHDNVGAIGARDPSEQVFPTWSGAGGPQGEGVTVAVLDDGVNDQAEAAMAGARITGGRVRGRRVLHRVGFHARHRARRELQPIRSRERGHGGHGTHVAGIVLGSGGPSGFARGVAPAARLVDVKVLNETGSGTELPEALDWCIHNAHRNWGWPDTKGST